ncbi:MAG: hypothetical protein ACJ8CR_22880 [Roseiflexaceae bacterium]
MTPIGVVVGIVVGSSASLVSSRTSRAKQLPASRRPARSIDVAPADRTGRDQPGNCFAPTPMAIDGVDVIVGIVGIVVVAGIIARVAGEAVAGIETAGTIYRCGACGSNRARSTRQLLRPYTHGHR